VSRSSAGLRQLQTGFARSYALTMLTGALLVVGAILAVQLW
jgi:NADH-quinone oxidoreductase subunit L